MRRYPSTQGRRCAWLLRAVVGLVASCITVSAHAGPKRGDVLQTDGLSMLLVSHDYTTNTNSSIRNIINLSGNVGLHYYFVDRVRLGMSLQFTERIWPEPPAGSSRFQRFALMPQLGWSFYDPFFTALLFSYAPRTQGRALPDMAVLAALGAALPISDRVKFSVALEGSYAFLHHRTLGLVAITGISFRF
jgi:hypothetical protein